MGRGSAHFIVQLLSPNHGREMTGLFNSPEKGLSCKEACLSSGHTRGMQLPVPIYLEGRAKELVFECKLWDRIWNTHPPAMKSLLDIKENGDWLLLLCKPYEVIS